MAVIPANLIENNISNLQTLSIELWITMAVIPANLIENNISNLQTLSIELRWL